jgi:Fe-S cluster biosynthesis and repair protein YggX
MNDVQERIKQFRKMAADDPDNELGHYRLGDLLMQAGEYQDAAASFRRTLELSPQFAKVFQLLATCLLKLDQRDEAVKVLTEGFTVADRGGHYMPRDEMAKMLQSLGQPVPTRAEESKPEAGAEGTGFRCQRPGCVMGTHAKQLAAPPMKDDVGRRVYEHVCSDCWTEWLKNYSIKVINEMRLDLSTERGQEEYDRYMKGFFGFEE